ncbi:leucyl aminopeptidase family protein [Novispirillum sp. DQ9]|uniref:leucyl aminopeptidase family protein n=1 Tax=Novispirillum sp. DQ9 TaxID=3398612 RepID=UPI003C7A6041
MAGLDVTFTAGPLEEESSSALVVGVWEGGNLSAAARALSCADRLERAVAASPAFTGKPGQSLSVAAPEGGTWSRVVLAGLGPYDAVDAAVAATLGADLAAALAGSGEAGATLDLGLAPALAAACAAAFRLRAHRTPDLRGAPPPDEPPRLSRLTVRVGDPRAAEDAFAARLPVIEGIEQARDLVAEPANRLTPQTFAAKARALESLGVAVEVLDAAALEAQGLRLHAAVGRASANPPCLVVLRWRGAPDADAAPVLLVGKGLTFDTGGLSIKPAAGMEEMKGDMGGAAAVFGTLRAAAAARAPVNLTGILALAENMPGGDAWRPGDVLVSHAGKTVEVIDTDAEGRMVLADALSWGCATERPAAVVDLATLTGSIVVALGAHHAGLFSTDTALADALRAAGTASGEALWPMPLSAAVDDDLRSDIADLLQCAPSGSGMWGGRLLPDALHAARFLSHFVPDGVPYAHLDIAGTAERKDAAGPCPAGPTGFGVGLLCAWLGIGSKG